MSWSFALFLLAQAADPATSVPHDPWMAQNVPEQLTDEEACAMFQDRAQRLAPELPKRMTYGLYRLRSAVDCAARTYRVEDEVTVQASALSNGWQADEQGRWNAEFCDSLVTLPLLWRGWRIVQQVSLQDGRKIEFVPKCE